MEVATIPRVELVAARADLDIAPPTSQDGLFFTVPQMPYRNG